MGNEQLRENLAAYAHAAWSGWMKYLFEQTSKTAKGEEVIGPYLVGRWRRQLETPYADLPEEEKESDRVEADKMLKICRRHAPLRFTSWFLGSRGAVEAVLVKAKRELKCVRQSRELDVADVLDALDEAGLLR